jgi:hypothetical protein
MYANTKVPLLQSSPPRVCLGFTLSINVTSEASVCPTRGINQIIALYHTGSFILRQLLSRFRGGVIYVTLYSLEDRPLRRRETCLTVISGLLSRATSTNPKTMTTLGVSHLNSGVKYRHFSNEHTSRDVIYLLEEACETQKITQANDIDAWISKDLILVPGPFGSGRKGEDKSLEEYASAALILGWGGSYNSYTANGNARHGRSEENGVRATECCVCFAFLLC